MIYRPSMKALRALGMWMLLGFGITGLVFYLVTRPWFPGQPTLPVIIYGVVVIVPILGAFWMMYTAIRNEKNPWPFILLAFLPFTSLWYYFDRFEGTDGMTNKNPIRSTVAVIAWIGSLLGALWFLLVVSGLIDRWMD